MPQARTQKRCPCQAWTRAIIAPVPVKECKRISGHSRWQDDSRLSARSLAPHADSSDPRFGSLTWALWIWRLALLAQILTKDFIAASAARLVWLPTPCRWRQSLRNHPRDPSQRGLGERQLRRRDRCAESHPRASRHSRATRHSELFCKDGAHCGLLSLS